jgi:hypothetical protein
MYVGFMENVMKPLPNGGAVTDDMSRERPMAESMGQEPSGKLGRHMLPETSQMAREDVRVPEERTR